MKQVEARAETKLIDKTSATETEIWQDLFAYYTYTTNSIITDLTDAEDYDLILGKEVGAYTDYAPYNNTNIGKFHIIGENPEVRVYSNGRFKLTGIEQIGKGFGKQNGSVYPNCHSHANWGVLGNSPMEGTSNFIVYRTNGNVKFYYDDVEIRIGFDPTKYNGLGNFIYQDYEAFGQYDPDDKIGDAQKRYVLECDYPVGTRLDVEWYMYIPKKSTWDLFQTWYEEGTMWDNIEKLTIPTRELEKTSTGETVYWYPIEQGMENYFNSFDWCYYVYNMQVEEHYDISRNEDYNVDGSRKRNAFVFDWDETMLLIFNENNIEIGYDISDYANEVQIAMLYYSFPRSAKVIATGEERTYNRKTSAYEWEEILKETTTELPEGWYDPSINQYYIDAYRTTDENFKNQLDDNTWFIIESWKAIPTPLRDLIIVMLCAGIIAGFIRLVM